MIKENWKIRYSLDARKDLKKLPSVSPAIRKKFNYLLDKIKENPYEETSKKLSEDFKGCFSLRINIKHRLVYEIFPEVRIVKIVSILGHYNG